MKKKEKKGGKAAKAKVKTKSKRKVSGKRKEETKKQNIDKIARRRFRVESPFRKATAVGKLPPNVSWDELIFCIVSGAGKRGINIEEICKKAIKIKYSLQEIKEKGISPRSLFHNSRITHIEAVALYLDNSAYSVLYGYRELTKR